MKISLSFLLLLVVTASCNFETSSNSSVSYTVTHAGTIVFNYNKTAVKNIYGKGFLRYEQEGEILTVENDDRGMVYYRINNEDETNIPNDEQSKLLAAAVKLLESTGDLKKSPYVLNP